MALVLEQINVEEIAYLSYLIGEEKAGVVAFFDSRRVVAIYLQRARELGVKITHVTETYIPADFGSGLPELKARTNAPIHGGKSNDY